MRFGSRPDGYQREREKNKKGEEIRGQAGATRSEKNSSQKKKIKLRKLGDASEGGDYETLKGKCKRGTIVYM